MKRVLRTTMMAMLVIMLLVGMMTPAAFAYGAVSHSLTVTVNMYASPAKGEVPATDVVPVTVTPIEGTEGSGQTYSVNCVGNGLTGTGSVDISFGSFVRPGIHKYGVSIGHSSQTNWVIDDQEKHYVVILSVINSDNSEGLEVKTAIRDAELVDGVYVYDESTTDKPDALIAEKFFASPMKITVNKRWPDGGARPIKVILYEVITTEENGKTTQEKVELDRITLDPSCNWQHTFTELDTRKEYVLDEIGYSGYHESYSYNTENPLHWFVTITNYKSLYQTGQLNWPIPVLMCFGSMFVLAGAYLMRKKEEPTNE